MSAIDRSKQEFDLDSWLEEYVWSRDRVRVTYVYQASDVRDLASHYEGRIAELEAEVAELRERVG